MNAPLRVSLDATAVPAAAAGAGQYVLALARALATQDDVALTVLSRRGDRARWARAVGGAHGKGRAQVLAAAPSPRAARLAWEQLRLPGLVRRSGVQVHHGPHYTMPVRGGVPVVVTIHDCTFFDHPEWHERAKVPFFRRAIELAARRASTLVCVSDVTAARLRTVTDVRCPVVVAPHGVDHDRFRPDEPAPGADAARLWALGVDPDRPLVVFVGTREPRKGLGALAAAFDLVAARHPRARLVVAGQPGWGPDELGRALADAHHPDQVQVVGYVDDATVPALMRRARVVAFPALEEGFGLPALEALACGAPLVTTTGTAMAEVAGTAAVLVAPGDVDDLAGALGAALDGSDGPGTAARRRAGLARAASYTWGASARRHVEAYRMAAGA